MSEFVQPNSNTYMTIKKIVSIHSEDRDITKYPQSSLFDVQLPTDYKNIVSITLDNIDIPKSIYVFSNHLHDKFYNHIFHKNIYWHQLNIHL